MNPGTFVCSAHINGPNGTVRIVVRSVAKHDDCPTCSCDPTAFRATQSYLYADGVAGVPERTTRLFYVQEHSTTNLIRCALDVLAGAA